MPNLLDNAKLLSAQSNAVKYILRKGTEKRLNFFFKTGEDAVDITNYTFKSPVATEIYKGTAKFTNNDFTFKILEAGNPDELGPAPIFGKVPDEEANGRATIEIPDNIYTGANPPVNPRGSDQLPIVICYLKYHDAPENGNDFIIPLVLVILRGVDE